MQPLRRAYTFDFAFPVERLWALVSDTPRWNEANGMPRYQVREQKQPDGSVRIFGRLAILGSIIEWEEIPSNWLAERWFEQVREFRNGPLRRLDARATLKPCEDGSSELTYALSFTPRNLLGWLVARRALAGYGDKVARLLRDAERLIRAEQPELFAPTPHLAGDALARARRIGEQVDASPYGHGLAQRLVEYIAGAQDVDLWSIRPLALAKRWAVAPRLAIEVCLQSVRAGLLESRWDLLCPRCRVSKSQTMSMGELPRGVHCDACNIDYRLDFASNVELSFSPSPSVRPVEYGHYCRSGPGVTPHIKGQCALAPGASASLPSVLAPGEYRLRTLEAGGECDITFDGKNFPRVYVDGAGIRTQGNSPRDEIALFNEGADPRTLIIEERDWLRDVLSAEQVTTLQAFRDLFSDQLLRPGDDVRIRNITFMFTDLVGSTALFETIGEADAYHVVREHFALLGEVAREYDGTIVKTIGDGIHAAFNTPDAALRAAIAMQRAVAGFNAGAGRDDMAIRIGLHTGSSISVTLNDRLDYYGTTVNLAARLEGQGTAGEITMSQSFVGDPAVSVLLQSYQTRQRNVTLKGIGADVAIVQIRPA